MTPRPHSGRGLQLVGAAVTYRAPDGTLHELGVISPGGQPRTDPQVHEDPREREFIDAGMASGGPPRTDPRPCTCRYQVRTMRSVTGECWDVAGPVETCDACLDAAPLPKPRPPQRDPWPCVFCVTEGCPQRGPDGFTHLVPTGRTITCSSCRAAGAPDYLP